MILSIWRILIITMIQSITNNVRAQLIRDRAVTCDSDRMLVHFEFVHPFDGVVFINDHFPVPGCRWMGDGGMRFMVPIAIANASACGLKIKKETGEFSALLVISPMRSILIDGVTALNARCLYNIGDVTLTLATGRNGAAIEISGASEETGLVTGSGGSPLLQMRILDGHGITGNPVTKASVGQRLTLDLLIVDSAIYDFYVHSCYAHDGSNSPEASVNIIDSNGCAVRLARAIDVPVFVSAPSLNGPKHVYVHMYGFQFTSSQLVYFECQVRPCVHSCNRQQCDAQITASSSSPPSSPAPSAALPPAATTFIAPRNRRADSDKVTQQRMPEVSPLKLHTILQMSAQNPRKAAQHSTEMLDDQCVDVLTAISVSLGLLVATTVSVLIVYCVCNSTRPKKKSRRPSRTETAYSVSTIWRSPRAY